MKNFHRIQSINVKVQKKRTVFSALLFNIFYFIGTSIYATKDASSLIQEAKTGVNESYLSSLFATTLLLKRSRNIRLLLMVFFVSLFVNFVSAQTTRTSTGSTTWNSASTWLPSGVPGFLDPVISNPGSGVTNTPITITYNGAIHTGGGSITVAAAVALAVKFTNASSYQKDASVAAVAAVQELPTATAGGSQSICANTTATISGATATNGAILWTENGAGSITSGATTLTPTYTPAAGDVGNTVTLTLTVTSSTTYDPQTATATYTITVNAFPTITAQPTNQLDCQGNIVSFNVVASGAGLTYVWQRKLPAEASFSNIPSDVNVSYPTPDKIRIQSIGSALSPNGTQYQVVVSNGTCSVNSSVATLSVNEITVVSPTATTVTQCYGTNYSYTASTSYPSNVVSYQWRSSVASGVWNNVIDGPHFSGATTATLNIINGTPAESAGYRVYITFNSSGADCNATSESRTRKLTFLPSLLTPDTMVTQPTCSLATGTITVTIQSVTDTYSFDNGLNYQASNIKSGLAAGNRNVIIKNGVGCVSVATVATIDVQPATLVQPILTAATQPTCTEATGSVVLSGLPTGTWTLTQSREATQTTGTGSSITIPGLASGFYTYTVSIGSCASVAPAEVEIYATTNTWNRDSGGGSWANTLTSMQAITFNGDYNSTGDLTACSCRVDSGAVVINSGHTLKITNEISVSGGGSLIFENNASLVQTNDAAINSGSILYKRTTSTLSNNYDFVYWGSPVAAQEIGKIWMASNWADTFYNYNPGTPGWARTYAANTMTPGKGYIARARNGQSLVNDSGTIISTLSVPGTWPATFSGVPNNGTITVTDCEAGKYCLLGNPYPSALDADAFLRQNKAVLDGTIYFWTHNTPMSNNAYNSNDYASYNGVGGTATSASISTGYNASVPSGKIAAGQGFFATAIATKEVIFNNSMRLSSLEAPIENTQFFKTSSNNKKTSRIEKHRVWLNLSNTLGVFKQTLVGYLTDATNDYDSRFDGESMNANTYADFYSINRDKNLTIQGRAVPFDENDYVPLGFKTAIAGSFTVKIDQVDGLFLNQAVFLEDQLTHTLFDLKRGEYTFTTPSGTFNDRFVLRYTDKTLGTAAVEKPANQVVVTIQNKQIKITSLAETIEKVFVYDVSGKQLYQKRKVNSTELLLTTLASSHQILVVKTVLQNGKSSTKKVLF
jgi:hypothetical protein